MRDIMSIPSPKERFAQELWWMLQQLEYLRISSKVNEELLFIIPWTSSAHPSALIQLTAIEKLEEKKILKVLKKIGIGDGLNMVIQLLQPGFDELFSQFSEERSREPEAIKDLGIENSEHRSRSSSIHGITFLKKTETKRLCYYRNGEWNRPCYGSGIRWEALYAIAQNGSSRAADYIQATKEIQNYFNTKTTCPLYSDGRFLKTKILKQENGILTACIDLKIITKNQLEIWKRKQLVA